MNLSKAPININILYIKRQCTNNIILKMLIKIIFVKYMSIRMKNFGFFSIYYIV